MIRIDPAESTLKRRRSILRMTGTRQLQRWDLNPRPLSYEPSELTGLLYAATSAGIRDRNGNSLPANLKYAASSLVGFEPATYRLVIGCSRPG